MKPSEILGDAAKEAVGEIGGLMRGGLELGPPPGAVPIAWQDQAATFIDKIGELLTGGPAAQELIASQGPDSVNAYVTDMSRKILQRKRQRRSPL